MFEYSQGFAASVALFTEALYEDFPHLWHFTNDEVEEAKHIMSLGITYADACDAVAIMRYYRREPTVTRTFTRIAEHLFSEWGWCERTVQALMIWNILAVRIPEHITKHKQQPLKLDLILNDLIENGDLDADTLY